MVGEVSTHWGLVNYAYHLTHVDRMSLKRIERTVPKMNRKENVQNWMIITPP